MEETAIRTRGFNEGHEFVLLVNLDNSNPPVWLPPTRLYLGFRRYGIDGVAGAIEARIQSVGGKVRIDSAVEHALKLDRQISFAAKKNSWRFSGEFERAGALEAERVVQELKRLAEEIHAQTRLHPTFDQKESGHCVLSVDRTRLLVEVYRPSLSEYPTFVLHIWINEGGTFLGPYAIEEPTKIDEGRYEIDLDATEQSGWQLDGRFLTSLQVADVWLKRLLDSVRQRRTKSANSY